MRLSVDFSGLEALARKMGRFPPVELPLIFVFEPIDGELEAGTTVDPYKYTVTGGVLPTYEGRQVVLYIKDHSYVRGSISNFDRTIEDPAQGNKIHVAFCRTLEEMVRLNRFERYVVCNNITGDFEIQGPAGQPANVKLHVCKNCLSLLNYQGARDDISLRNKLAVNFNYNEFFKTYSSSFKHKPKGMANDDVGYSADWEEISRTLREKANYTCSDCQVNLMQNQSLCHVHHINGVKNDNSPANLEVLCADCHRKRHGSAMYVRHQDIKTINRLRKQQSLMQGGWEEALELADPAVHGELLILQQRGYSTPEIGYEVVGNDGAVLAELEAAWPASRECLVIDDALDHSLLKGWQVWHFGDIAKQK